MKDNFIGYAIEEINEKFIVRRTAVTRFVPVAKAPAVFNHSKRTFSFAGKQLSNVTAASICTFAMAHLPSKFPNHMK